MTTDAVVIHELRLANMEYTHGMRVDDTTDGFHGHVLCQNTMNDASAPSNNNNQQDLQLYDNFIALKKRRDGLNFCTINKEKGGSFNVSVTVDDIDYFGKGPTIKEANNDCAANVLSAMDSGLHGTQKDSLYTNAFDTLKRMYGGLMYHTLPNINDRYDVCVEVDGIEYYGNGKTIKEANNDTAWAAFKSIKSGAHKKQLQESEEYWFDEDYLGGELVDATNCTNCLCPYCPYYN